MHRDTFARKTVGSGRLALLLTAALALGVPTYAFALESPSPSEESEDTESNGQTDPQDPQQDPEKGSESQDGQEPSRSGRGFGSPDQVDNQIASDREATSRLIQDRLLGGYFAWKENLQEKRGLSLSVDYSAVYLRSNEALEDKQQDGAGGIARFYGSWELVGRESGNTGAFIWKVEHRHAYGSIAPKGFASEIGYAGLFEPPFSNQGWRFTNFYWRQRWKAGAEEPRVTLFSGFLDATDYLDVYALASPWTGFMNFAFSTGTQTIPVPNDATLGVAAGGMVTSKLFLIGGVVDRNADPKRFWEGFDTYFSDSEYFKSIEIGWTPSSDRIYLDNTHLTLWDADERTEAGEAGGWGANFSWTRYLASKWLPFLRGGYASEGGSLMQKSMSVGAAYQPDPGGDVLGFGFNWGEVNEDTWGQGLSDQYTAEVYFRWNVSPQFALTPDIQYLIDPALNPEADSLWILGLRARLAL